MSHQGKHQASQANGKGNTITPATPRPCPEVTKQFGLDKNAHTGEIVAGSGQVSALHQRKYSVPEAAKLLGISETNLRLIIQRGEIEVIRILPTKVLISEAVLETYIKSKTGTIQIREVKQSRIPDLPDFVKTSKYLSWTN